MPLAVNAQGKGKQKLSFMFEVLLKRKRLILIATIVVVAAFAALVFVPDVFAQEAELAELGQAAGLPETDIRVVIARIIRAAIMLVGVIFVGLVVYGGVLWMTSGGDPEKLKKAKLVFRNSFIGLVIIFASYSIASFILNALLSGSIWGPVGYEPTPGVEPLSGSLGSGIIEDHYPRRYATDIPRNTKIIITFKEGIDIASLTTDLIEDADGDPETLADNTWTLNSDNIKIFKNVEGEDFALTAEEVRVNTTADQDIWVFEPVELLGSASEETNYTVVLKSDILKADGTAAFVGVYGDGYEWTFEVSTVVDLTPPYITSVIPSHASERDRNIVIQINFNEAIDPTSASGTYDELGGFTNILAQEVVGQTETTIEGEWTISNGYKTVEFVTFDACGEDPCGDTIYCLPPSAYIQVTAKAATMGDEPPEADGFPYDGVVDVVGNSLDGGVRNHNPNADETTSANGIAEGPDIDNYIWAFETTDEINDTIPSIYGISPGVKAEEVALDADVEIIFTAEDDTGPLGPGVTMMSSTLTNRYISLTASPWHELWYVIDQEPIYAGYDEAENGEPVATKATINHAVFLETVDPASPQYYYPSIPNEVKSSYQICFYPAQGPGEEDPYNTVPPADVCQVNSSYPSCCSTVPGVECIIP